MPTTTRVRKYVDDVVRRARTPMPPLDHVVLWDQQPRRHKVFSDAAQFEMPVGEKCRTRLSGALSSPSTSPSDVLDVGSLGRALHDTYGLLSRRLRVTGNDDAVNKTVSAVSTYSRGTANGGGLYPLEFYWVSGSSARQLPGVYHWNTASGTMQRLLVGDAHDRVRAAIDDDCGTDQFLLVTVKLWKNAFKYNSFSHHVVTMDLGTVLATLALSGLSGDSAARTPRLWFDSAGLDGLLGLDPFEETTLAVLPLPPGAGDLKSGTVTSEAGVRFEEAERFPGSTRFPQVVDVMRDSFADTIAPAIDVVLARTSSGQMTSLPPSAESSSALGLSDLLAARRSSFGTFSSNIPLGLAELAHVLRTTDRGARLLTDAGRAQFARVAVFCNHVEGISPGGYVYDHEQDALVRIDDEDPGLFLQATYFLDNYNVEQAAAVLAILVPADDVLAAGGSRTVRLLNAVVGAATQSAYLAATDLGLACGAALGFDNVAYAERLRVIDTGEWPLIMIMIGRDRVDQADFAAPLDLDAKE